MDRIEIHKFEEFFSRMVLLTNLLCGKVYFEYQYTADGKVGYFLIIALPNANERRIFINSDSLEYSNARLCEFVEIIETVLESVLDTSCFSTTRPLNKLFGLAHHPIFHDDYSMYMRHVGGHLDKYSGKLLRDYYINNLTHVSDKKKIIDEFLIRYNEFAVFEHDNEIVGGLSNSRHNGISFKDSSSLILVAFDVFTRKYAVVFIQLNPFDRRDEFDELTSHFQRVKQQLPFLQNHFSGISESGANGKSQINIEYSVKDASWDRVFLLSQQFAIGNNKTHFSYEVVNTGLSLVKIEATEKKTVIAEIFINIPITELPIFVELYLIHLGMAKYVKS